LLVGRLGDAGCLSPSVSTQVADDRGPLLLGFRADAAGLDASLGKLGLVLLKSGLSLLLSLLGLVHAALDGSGAVGIRLLEAGNDLLLHDDVKDGDRDETEDQLARVGQKDRKSTRL